MTMPEETNPTASPAPSLPPNTTAQQDLVVARQTRINLIWEFTQAVISIMITSAVIYSELNSINAPVLTNAFFLIVSMYYVRTNHAIIGGIGNKPANESR